MMLVKEINLFEWKYRINEHIKLCSKIKPIIKENVDSLNFLIDKLSTYIENLSNFNEVDIEYDEKETSLLLTTSNRKMEIEFYSCKDLIHFEFSHSRFERDHIDLQVYKGASRDYPYYFQWRDGIPTDHIGIERLEKMWERWLQYQ